MRPLAASKNLKKEMKGKKHKTACVLQRIMIGREVENINCSLPNKEKTYEYSFNGKEEHLDISHFGFL